MCDTMVALAEVTADGGMLFGKNSDRERNEAQVLQQVPAASHAPGDQVRLTYISIDQAQKTNACLLSRPYWMWGAEMGANDHGLVIGNEAVFSHVPAARRKALTGMDLVRLALERASTAAEAVEVITGLLEQHGQGGDCGHYAKFYYHNSFMIADHNEVFVLETVGRWWAVQRVRGARAISNSLSLDDGYDSVSQALADHAAAEGWTDQRDRFDFAARFAQPGREGISFGGARCERASQALWTKRGTLTSADIRTILRDHGPAADGNPAWTPEQTVGRTICMHAGPGSRRSQTVASWTSEVSGEQTLHWVTGGAAPCLSLFKPALVGVGLPGQGPAACDQYDPATRWWKHEGLHRTALADFAAALALIEAERDTVEAEFAEQMRLALDADLAPKALGARLAACWHQADTVQSVWAMRLAKITARRKGSFGRSWAQLDHRAGLPIRG